MGITNAIPLKLHQYKIDGYRNRSEALYISNITGLTQHFFFSGSRHISHVCSGVKYEVGINIFAKCVVQNVTCSSGTEVHI